MLSEPDATIIVKRVFPEHDVSAPVSYRGLYVFIVTDPTDPEEGDFDPFYSVNQTTGELAEFSILTDGNPSELAALFAKK
jgi:hypothetical protein